MHGLEPRRALGDLVGAGTCDAPGERGAVRADELDRVARVEAALAADDADGEQARALLRDRTPRAPSSTWSAPDGGLREAKPELEGGGSLARRRGSACPRLAGDDRPEHVAARRPPAITVGIPAAAAIRAASDLAPHAAAPERDSVAERGVVRRPTPSASSSAPGVPGARV